MSSGENFWQGIYSDYEKFVFCHAEYVAKQVCISWDLAIVPGTLASVDVLETSAYSLEPETQEEPIEYPYRTGLRIVLYGGFEVFHEELLKLLPDVWVVEYAVHIDTTAVQNADIVFLQTSKTAHSGYDTVCDACKSCGVPYIHLNYAGARRCADVIVREIRKRERADTEA